MIVLDTNVVSALMLRQPDRQVVGWLDRQAAESVWTTAITVFEVRFGLALLPAGRRRRSLEEAFTSRSPRTSRGASFPSRKRPRGLPPRRRLVGN
jgi:predicted nucleic acid-binding protein